MLIAQSMTAYVYDVLIYLFFSTQFLCQAIILYPENPEGTQVIVGSMNMGYISDTARNRTTYLENIPNFLFNLNLSLTNLFLGWLDNLLDVI